MTLLNLASRHVIKDIIAWEPVLLIYCKQNQNIILTATATLPATVPFLPWRAPTSATCILRMLKTSTWFSTFPMRVDSWLLSVKLIVSLTLMEAIYIPHAFLFTNDSVRARIFLLRAPVLRQCVCYVSMAKQSASCANTWTLSETSLHWRSVNRWWSSSVSLYIIWKERRSLWKHFILSAWLLMTI